MRDVDAAQGWLESWATGGDADAARVVELSRRVQRFPVPLTEAGGECRAP